MLGLVKEVASVLGAAARMAAVYALAMLALYFPRHVGDSSNAGGATDFYQDAYAAGMESAARADAAETRVADSDNTSTEAEARYVEIAREASDRLGVSDTVHEFVARHALHGKRLLEVGAGSGYFQDVVEDYTALDIAESARKYFHKPFVQGSATDLPFADEEFDAVMTIFVLEHIPDPERALEEIRRVLKPGGVLLLAPAWNCTSWLADGYAVRPYADLDLAGKLVKSSLLVRALPLYRAGHTIPVRASRHAFASLAGGPTRLRYTPLRANFDTYWQADSDAVASIDAHEAYLWFTSRGDECLNCPGGLWGPLGLGLEIEPLIIRVRKPGARQSIRS